MTLLSDNGELRKENIGHMHQLNSVSIYNI